MSDNGGRGWSRFLAEAAVIVSSILLALAVDAWWDGVQADRSRTELVQALTVDFETTRLRLAESIRHGDSLVAGTSAFLIGASSPDPLPVDSLRSLADNAFRPLEFRPATSSYEGARASGELQQLGSRELIEAFAEFDQSMAYFEDRSRVFLDWYYLGEVAELRKAQGSLFGLAPMEDAATSVSPVAHRSGYAVPNSEYLQLARSRAVQGLIEGGVMLRWNLVRGLRQADTAAARVLDALQRLGER